MTCRANGCNKNHPDQFSPETQQELDNFLLPLERIYAKVDGEVTRLASNAGRIALFSLPTSTEPVRVAVIKGLAQAQRSTTLVVRNRPVIETIGSRRTLETSAWLLGSKSIKYTTETIARGNDHRWATPQAAPRIDVQNNSTLQLYMRNEFIEPMLAYPLKPGRFFRPTLEHSDMLMELRDTLTDLCVKSLLDEEVVHYLPPGQSPPTNV